MQHDAFIHTSGNIPFNTILEVYIVFSERREKVAPNSPEQAAFAKP
jgi:hypothetical protein